LFQRFADLATAMSQLHQGQNVLLLAVSPYNGHPGGLAAGINLDPDRLSISANPAFQPDRKRIRTHHHCSTTVEQKPRTPFGARHKGVFASIQYEDRHRFPFNECPYGPCDGGRSLSPLGNVYHRLPLARQLKPSALYLSPA
jgi:hypothetical protein